MIVRGLKKRVGRDRPWRSERGQAQVEFVLSITFVLLLIFGIFEMIMLLYTYNVLADATKEGVRYAIVNGSDSANASNGSGCSTSSPAAVITQVRNYAKTSFHDVSGMTVNVCYPDGSNLAPNRVRITVSYPYQPLLGFSWPNVTINAAAEGRIAY